MIVNITEVVEFVRSFKTAVRNSVWEGEIDRVHLPLHLDVMAHVLIFLVAGL